MDDKQTAFHVDHQLWLRSLDFYEDEIKFFNHELTQVVMKNDQSFSKLEYVEEYRLIFKKKLNHIKELRIAIASHEHRLVESVNEASDGKLHGDIKTAYNDFVDQFEKLKKNFRRFASHND